MGALFKEEDAKKIQEICFKIAGRNMSLSSRLLSAQDIVAFDLLYSNVKMGVEVKVAEIAKAFYPTLKRKFFELRDFYVVDSDTINVACYDLDGEVFTFSFPIKMLDMNEEEIESYTFALFRKEIQKHKEELEKKKKEVELLEQKINELEQTFY